LGVAEGSDDEREIKEAACGREQQGVSEGETGATYTARMQYPEVGRDGQISYTRIYINLNDNLRITPFCV
jgi:hypothetical protein